MKLTAAAKAECERRDRCCGCEGPAHPDGCHGLGCGCAECMRILRGRMPAAMIVCGIRWDSGGFEGDAPWHGIPCVLPAGHSGWHESEFRAELVNGHITWLVGR